MLFREAAPYYGGLQATSDAHVQTHTRDDVCERVCEVSSKSFEK